MANQNLALLQEAAWLVQRLCHANGEPCDGPRFRDGIFAIRIALGGRKSGRGVKLPEVRGGIPNYSGGTQ